MQIDRVLSAALALPDLDSTVRESIKDGNYMIALHVLGNDSAAKWHARLRAAFDAGELREIDVLSGLVIAPAIKGSSARTKDEREAAKKQLVDIAHRNANEEWQNRPSGTNPNKEVLGKRIAARLRRMAYTVRVDHGAAAPSLGSF